MTITIFRSPEHFQKIEALMGAKDVKINELRAMLNEACNLLMIEARDHNSNYVAPKDRRKNIAQILEMFCKKVARSLNTDQQ